MKDASTASSGMTSKWLMAGGGTWFVMALLASGTGWLGQLSPHALPPIAFTLMALPAVLFWTLPSVRSLVEGIGLRTLTALHISRVLAVPLFFWYGGRGLLPQSFVNHAGWGDLISGVVALGVVTLWPRRAGYWTAHLVGLVDFLGGLWDCDGDHAQRRWGNARRDWTSYRVDSDLLRGPAWVYSPYGFRSAAARAL